MGATTSTTRIWSTVACRVRLAVSIVRAFPTASLSAVAALYTPAMVSRAASTAAIPLRFTGSEIVCYAVATIAITIFVALLTSASACSGMPVAFISRTVVSLTSDALSSTMFPVAAVTTARAAVYSTSRTAGLSTSAAATLGYNSGKFGILAVSASLCI